MARPPIYKTKDGKRCPSVTTITGRYKETGALMWWANQIGLGIHESCESQPICRKCGRRQGLTQAEGKTPAADTGKFAHALIEEKIVGSEFERRDFEHLTQDQVDEATLCLETYVKWQSRFGVEYVSTELSLLSEAHKFGGTLDACGYIEGNFCLIDWKTSNGFYVDYLVQLAGYLILLEENGMPQVEEIHCLRFSKANASFEHRFWPRRTFEPAIDYFVAARGLYAMEAPLKKMLK